MCALDWNCPNLFDVKTSYCGHTTMTPHQSVVDVREGSTLVPSV